MSFWETLPGLIASWAAAVTGLIFLADKGWKAAVRTWRWLGRLVSSINRLLEIGDEDSWPNGSKSLPQSITTIYNRLESGAERFDSIDGELAKNHDRFDSVDGELAKNHELLEAYIKTHRQDHELLQPNT